MNKKFSHLDDEEARVFDPAQELTEEQIRRAVEITNKILVNDARQLDGAVLASVIQSLAINQLFLALNRRMFSNDGYR